MPRSDPDPLPAAVAMPEPETTPAASSSSTLDDIMKDLREQYEKNESLRPFMKKLEGKTTAAEISAVFRGQVKEYNSAPYDKLMNSLNPVINVLCASSSVIGAGVGLVFSPASVIFAGADALLSAANGVIASYNALILVFERIGNFFHRLEKNTEKPTMEAIKDVIVDTMAEVLKIFAFMTKEVKLGRTMRFLKNFARDLIGKAVIQDALSKLDRLTQEGVNRVIEHVSNTTDRIESNVGAALGELRVVHRELGPISQNIDWLVKDGQERKTREDEEKERQKIEDKERKAREEEEKRIKEIEDGRRKVREDKRWLSPPDPSTNQNKNIASQDQREESATWIFEENIFMEWNLWGSKSTTSLLWIHGKPGSGKSVLCSAIIEDITALQRDGLATMAYFYFVFNDSNKQSLDNALRSLLTQLSASSDSYCDILSRVYKDHTDGTYRPNTKKMSECLKEMLKLPNQRPVYIILDALDECPNTSGVPPFRKEVLDLLKELVDLRLSHLHICVTSRRDGDIEAALTRLTFHSISIQDQDGLKKDIEDYIKSVVYAESDMAMGGWNDQDRGLVVNKLTDKANGMFQWVFCQLEVLQDCDREVISQTLNELPDSLDGTYERVLKEIGKANQRHRLGDRPLRFLQCLAMAIRPLRVEEMTEILALDFGGAEGAIPKMTKGSQSEDRLPRVLSTCSSLVEIVDNGDSRVIQFSHFSVKEFLTSDRLAISQLEGNISRFHIKEELAHTTLAQACLGFLLHMGDSSNLKMKSYASRYWVKHAQFEKVSSRIEVGIRRLIDPAEPYLSAWLQLHDFDDPWTEFGDSADPHRGSLLYYASLCGFCDLAAHIIDEHPEQVNARGGRNHSPLAAALYKTHFDVAKLLRQHGADMDVTGLNNRTLLQAASVCGRSDVARWLLDQANGHPEVVRTLLDHGRVRIKDADGAGDSPLRLATEYRQVEIVRLLLNRGANANPDPEGKYGRSLLYLATEGWLTLWLTEQSTERSAQIARLLLDHGARPEVIGISQLEEALRMGKYEHVRLLIELGCTSPSR